MTLEEKIKIINETNSFDEIPLDVLPPSHKENYYFVSYSHKDYKRVFVDILRLEALGINIWYDNDMHIGENWKEIAQLYISKFQCSGIIFYLTDNSIKSPACNQEVEYVLTHNKKFISINKPLDGHNVQSGYGMLQTLKEQGFICSNSLEENFKKAFSDEILYLGINDSIESKAHQILSIEKENLFDFEVCNVNDIFEEDQKGIKINSCKDNSLISVDISKIYEVDDFSDNISIIDDCVFTNSIKLQSVYLSDKLQKIGDGAFRNCISLENINFPINNKLVIGNKAFYNCSKLKNVDLSKVLKIESEAFKNCKQLVINQLSGEIYKEAFTNTSISNIEYIDENPRLRNNAFYYCNSLQNFKIINKFYSDLGNSVFEHCENLEEVGPFITPTFIRGTNEASLNVGEKAFYHCNKLKNIVFKGAWNIDNSTSLFAFCDSLEHIDLDIKSTKIPKWFASFCTNLKDITNFNRINHIGYKAFEKCINLKELDLENVKTLDKECFTFSGIEKAYLKNIEVIDNAAFLNCNNLKSVYIGECCKSIGPTAFAGCINIFNLTILSNDIHIENNAFLGCKIRNLTLQSKNVLNYFKDLNLLNEVYVLYIDKNINLDNYVFEQFTLVETDKSQYNKLINKNYIDLIDIEGNVDITSSELNEKDDNYPKYEFNKNKLFDLLGTHVLIKHRRMKKPENYFLEQIKLCDNESKIDYVVVSIHTNKSFKIDGTLIESIDLGKQIFGDYIQIDEKEELNGKEVCIVSNNEYHYCKVLHTYCPTIPSFGKNGKFRYNVIKVIISEDNNPVAISGIDIQTIVLFDENFTPSKVFKIN